MKSWKIAIFGRFSKAFCAEAVKYPCHGVYYYPRQKEDTNMTSKRGGRRDITKLPTFGHVISQNVIEKVLSISLKIVNSRRSKQVKTLLFFVSNHRYVFENIHSMVSCKVGN